MCSAKSKIQNKINRASLPFVGRDNDVDFLLKRVEQTGITVITAPPQLGKSTLLFHFLDTLESRPEQDYEWGYARGNAVPRGTILLRAIDDAYENWIQRENWKDELKRTIGDLSINDFVKKAGKISAHVLSTISAEGFVAKELISSALRKISSDDFSSYQKLSGSIEYDDAKEVCELIARISNKKLVLVLDAFEQTENPEIVSSIIDAFLEECIDWPHVHIIVAVRSNVGAKTKEVLAYRLVEQWQKKSIQCRLLKLPSVSLLKNHRQQQELMSYLINNVGALNSENINQYFVLSNGNPAIWVRWVEANCESEIDLKKQHEEALEYKYSELEANFENVSGQVKDIAALLSMVPEVVDNNFWADLVQFVPLLKNPDSLDELQRQGVLITQNPPSFGLTERYHYAQKIALTQYPNHMDRVLESAVKDCLKHVLSKINKNSNGLGLILLWNWSRAFSNAISPGLVKFCSAAGQLIRLSRADEYLFDVIEYTSNHKNDELDELLSFVIYDLFWKSTYEKNMNLAARYFNYIVDIVNRRPASELAQYNYSQAVGYYCYLAETVDETLFPKEHIGLLLEGVSKFKKNQEIALVVSNALVTLNQLSTGKKGEHGYDYLEIHSELSRSHNLVKIREDYAKGLLNRILFNKEDFERASLVDSIEKIGELRNAEPNNELIDKLYFEIHAKSIAKYSELDFFEEADVLLDKLFSALSTIKTRESAISSVGEAVYAKLYFLFTKGKAEEDLRWIGKYEQLEEKFGYSPKWAEWFCQSTVLVIHHRCTNNFDPNPNLVRSTLEMFRRIEKCYRDYSSSLNVVRLYTRGLADLISLATSEGDFLVFAKKSNAFPMTEYSYAYIQYRNEWLAKLRKLLDQYNNDLIVGDMYRFAIEKSLHHCQNFKELSDRILIYNKLIRDLPNYQTGLMNCFSKAIKYAAKENKQSELEVLATKIGIEFEADPLGFVSMKLGRDPNVDPIN